MCNILEYIKESLIVIVVLLISSVIFGALFNLGIYMGTTIRTMGCI